MSNFFDTMAPYAARASKGSNLDEGVILAQWALESAKGTSDLALRAKNFAGITWWGGNIGHKDPTSGYAAYDSIDQFVDDWIQTINQSHYTEVIHAGTVSAQIHALGASPWAESHYAYTPQEAPNPMAVGVAGRMLNDIYYANSLGQYSGGSIPASQPSQPSAIDPQTLKMAAIGVAFVGLMALVSSNN